MQHSQTLSQESGCVYSLFSHASYCLPSVFYETTYLITLQFPFGNGVGFMGNLLCFFALLPEYAG